MTSYIRDFWTYTSHQLPTVGDIKMSTIPADHMGWLLCDGRELSKKDFRFLYDIIGSAYAVAGDSDTTKFRLPRAAGRVPGFINSLDVSGRDPGLYPWSLGDMSGTELHTLTIPEMPSHNHSWLGDVSGVGVDGITDTSGAHIHTINETPHQHSYTTYANSDRGYVATTDNDGILGGTQSLNTSLQSTGITINSNGAHAHHIHSAGGDQPHNNIQPTIFIGNMFIYSGKPRQGTYPLSIAPKYSFY